MPQLLFLSRRNTVVLSGVTFVEAYSIKKKHPKANQTIEQIHNDTSNIQCLLCLRLRNKMGGKKKKIKCHYSVHLKGRHFSLIMWLFSFHPYLYWLFTVGVGQCSHHCCSLSEKGLCGLFWQEASIFVWRTPFSVYIHPPSKFTRTVFFVVFHSFCRFVVGFTKVKLSCPCNFNIPTLSSVNTSLILSAMPLYTIVSTVLGESLSNLYSVSFIDHFFFIRLSKKVWNGLF